jgi:cyclopropane fatty-acyl-phospholipid synthase-like methyltransferase
MALTKYLIGQPFVYRLHARLFGTERTFQRLLVEAGYRPGMRLLDIGCGPGELSKYVAPNDYEGIDVSEEYINSARQRHRGSYHVLPADRVGELTSPPFDLAMVVGVFHHLSDEQVRATLAGLTRVMKPQGCVIVLEAIWPTHRANIPGYFIRRMDRGDFIRNKEQWLALLGTYWQIEHARVTHNFVLEYFECSLFSRQIAITNGQGQ